jgi:membrane associated rhomboid family serine protease
MFFLLNTFFVAIALWFLTPSYVVTIGISGFCNALLAYLWIDLHTTRHPMANQLLFWLVVNIIIGFTGNISLVGHASGAVFGLLWWYWGRK